jgi:predicted dienelactone hydrolase
MNGVCSLRGLSSDATAFGLMAQYLASLGFVVTMIYSGLEVQLATDAPERTVREYLEAHRG